MSFVTPQIKEALKNHVLEEALPFGRGFLAYYMRDPGQGRMMSTLFVFTPEGIVIMGDLCPGGPGNRGSISSYNYGIGWFSRPQGEYYLCEKFLSREWQSVVAARWVREYMEEVKKEDPARIEEWQDILTCLEGGEMGEESFFKSLQDLDYDLEDEGYEYHLNTAGWLCGLQQRFVELYAAFEAPMICDDCNTRPEWKGQHRCHTPEGESAPMVVGGKHLVGVCDCSVSGQCKPPTKEELEAFRKNS